MKTKLAFLILFCSLFSQADELQFFPYQIHTQRLENGFSIYVVPMNTPGIVSYYTVVRVGSRNEVEPGKTGFAHFFEHMMFRGTSKYPEQRRAAVIKKLGADSNAFTTEDYTCYYITASAESLETIMEMEADRFQNLSYDIKAFQKEAGAILGEYNKSAMNPYMALEEKLLALAYKKHTYRHTVIGFLSDIQKMPQQYDYSLQFYRRYYRPENTAVVISGDVRPEEVFALARKYYNDWTTGAVEPLIPPEPVQTAERRTTVFWESPTQPFIYIAYHIPAFPGHERELAALQVLTRYLFSQKSTLYRKLVLEERSVSSLTAEAQLRRDPGLFTILIKAKGEEDLQKIEREVYRTIQQFFQDSIDTSFLGDIKSNLRYSLLMRLSKPGTVAYYLCRFISLSGRPEALDDYYRAILSVTPGDLKEAAANYLRKENRSVVILKRGSRR